MAVQQAVADAATQLTVPFVNRRNDRIELEIRDNNQWSYEIIYQIDMCDMEYVSAHEEEIQDRIKRFSVALVDDAFVKTVSRKQYVSAAINSMIQAITIANV
jgi:hypothetical protein